MERSSYKNDRMSEKVQSIRARHTLHQESNGKLESGTNSRKSNPRRSRDPKKFLSGRTFLATDICKSNDVEELYSKKIN